jgi:hypothetical protein
MRTLVEEHVKESNKDSHFIPRMIAMAVSVAVFAYSFGYLVLNTDVQTLDYRESGNVNYQVCLKPNNYFAEECQPAGKQYVASLINSVNATFEYSFRADENVKYDYSYDVTAKLIATESSDSDKILYENEEVILPSKNVTGQSGQSFAIKEALDINYDKYNNLITAFRSDYGLTINANVIVTMNVKSHSTHDAFSKPLDTKQAVALKIPLSERTINVAMESDQLNNSGALEETLPNLTKNFVFVLLAGVSAVIFLIDLIMSIVIFVRRESHRSTYEKTLGHILHEYSQLIVEVERVPQVPRSKLIEVKNFDELLDARDTIQQPILHLTIADSRSLFVIEDQDMAYVYVLSDKSTRKRAKDKGVKDGGSATSAQIKL